MNRLHIVGHKDHGKTRLIVELVSELKKRGLRVGAIKHTHHQHELDTPGKDSHRHRIAGADMVGIHSNSMNAIFLPIGRDSTADPYQPFAPLFGSLDITLVEGDPQASAVKIEVWRADQNVPPLSKQDESILAVVTDGPLELSIPVLSRRNIARLAEWVIEQCVQR